MSQQNPYPGPNPYAGPNPGAQPGHPPRRLTRSSTDKMIGGVCGGLAEYAGLDPTLVRVLAVVALCFGFPAILIGYFVAWAIMPRG